MTTMPVVSAMSNDVELPSSEEPESYREMLDRTLAQANVLVERHPVGAYLKRKRAPEGHAKLVAKVFNALVVLQRKSPDVHMYAHLRYASDLLKEADDVVECSRVGRTYINEERCEAYAELVSQVFDTLFNEDPVEG